MKLKLKKGVNTNISVEFAILLGWVKGAWESSGLGEFLVTSLNDHHENKPKSAHNRGDAGDVRTWHHWEWDDNESMAYYYKKWRLPAGKKWKQVGHHSKEFMDWARGIQQKGIAVVVHPDMIEGVPHFHFARKVELWERVS